MESAVENKRAIHLEIMIFFASIVIFTQLKTITMVITDRFQCSIGEIERLMKANEIIPDLLKVPVKQCLNVSYDDTKVYMGEKIEYLETLAPPTDINWNYEEGSYYSLVLSGLDVPSRGDPNERESQHWVIGNIPGNNISAGDSIFPYQPPGMQYNQGTHRLAFVLFKQNGKKPIHFDEMDLDLRRTSVVRAYFSTEEFSKKYKFGNPFAINFFEFDI